MKIFNWLFIILLKGYKQFISPLLGKNNCRFYPTCSEYSMQAFKLLPFHKAFIKSVWRVLRCNPYNLGGYDPVLPETNILKNNNSKGKIDE